MILFWICVTWLWYWIVDDLSFTFWLQTQSLIQLSKVTNLCFAEQNSLNAFGRFYNYFAFNVKIDRECSTPVHKLFLVDGLEGFWHALRGVRGVWVKVHLLFFSLWYYVACLVSDHLFSPVHFWILWNSLPDNVTKANFFFIHTEYKDSIVSNIIKMTLVNDTEFGPCHAYSAIKIVLIIVIIVIIIIINYDVNSDYGFDTLN